MNREVLIKYGLIVVLSVLIVFIVMKVLDVNKIKALFVKEKYDNPVRQPSGNRDTAAPVVEKEESKDVNGVEEDSKLSESSSTVEPSDNSDSNKFKACNLSDNVKPEDLLPLGNTEFSSLNPVLDGGLKNKQFLDPSKLIGTNTIGQSNRNQSYDLRSEPPIPKIDVGPWMNTTIEADLTRRPLE